MNKAQLLADLAVVAGADSIVMIEEVETTSGLPANVNKYHVDTFIVAKSPANKKDVSKVIRYYFTVIDEGEAGEVAQYWKEEPANPNDDITTSTGSLKDVFNIFSSPELKSRTISAVLKAAQDVTNEDAGTANHTARLIWAKAALLDPIKYGEQMMSFVALNTTVQLAGGLATDNDIQYIVNSNIDKVAV